MRYRLKKDLFAKAGEEVFVDMGFSTSLGGYYHTVRKSFESKDIVTIPDKQINDWIEEVPDEKYILLDSHVIKALAAYHAITENMAAKLYGGETLEQLCNKKTKEVKPREFIIAIDNSGRMYENQKNPQWYDIVNHNLKFIKVREVIE